MNDVFDAKAFDQQLGVLPAETILEKPVVTIPDEDRKALNSAASAEPAGIKTGTPPVIGDYFAAFEAADTEDAAIDFAARLEKFTGTKPEGEVTSDQFYERVTEIEAEQEYLQGTQGYRAAKAILERTYENDEAREKDDVVLIENAVRNDLGRGYTNAKFDTEMGYYRAEGKLTPDGINFANDLRNQLKQDIERVEGEAKTYARTTAQETTANRQKIRDEAPKFKPLDVELGEDITAQLAEGILTGRLDEKLANLSTEDMFWVELALNKKARLAFAKAIDSRGREQGAKGRLANVLH